MGRPATTHLLASNTSEATPRQVIVLDTETTWRTSSAGEVHALRLWEASSVYRHPKYGSREQQEDVGGTSAAEIIRFIDRVVKSTPAAWLYCHNLSFDAAVTGLPPLLEQDGWVLGANNLASDAPWGHFSKGRKSLYLVDSHSLLPAPLAQLGEDLGYLKPPLPTDDDPIEVWRERCRADVQITLAAILQLMAWWDRNHCGYLSVTGPRSGYNMMRHLCIPRKGYRPPVPRGPGQGLWGQHGHGYPVIDPNPDARRQERDTLYQGRREAYRTGQLPQGLYVEVDMRHAHLSVTGGWPLPCRRGLAFEQLDIDSPLLDSPNMGVIADALITTDVPDYPLRTPGGIVYPVGTFRTTLAGPELSMARRAGHLRQVGAGWYHRLSWWMQPWSDQIGRLLDDPDADAPPMAKVFAKAASRTVPGRMASRTSRVIATGTSPVTGWHVEHGLDIETGNPITQLHHNGQLSVILRDLDADDAYPGVYSWITSIVRVQLARAMKLVGQHRIVSVSTDAMIVAIDVPGLDDGQRFIMGRESLSDEQRAKMLVAVLDRVTPGITWGVKGIYHRIRVATPQHLVLDDARRMSGVPKAAVEQTPMVWRYLTWPKLSSHLAAATGDTYRRTWHQADLSALTVPRWMYTCGCTRPPQVRPGTEQTPVVLPSDVPLCPRHAAPLLPRQHAALRLS